MQRFLGFVSISVLIVLTSLWANECLNEWLIGTSDSNNANKIRRLFGPAPDFEVCILGDSRALEHVLPSELHPNAFNYAISGSSMRETVLHLQALLARKNHDVILINLEPHGIGNFTVRGDYCLVADNPLVRASGLICVPFVERAWGLRHLYKIRRNLMESELVNRRLGVRSKVYDKGAIVGDRKMSDAQWDAMLKDIPSSVYAEDPETRDLLFKTLAQVGEHKVVFFVSPIVAEIYANIQGKGKLTGFLAELNALKNVWAIDFAAAKLYDKSLFADPLHLNLAGAKRLTNELRMRLMLLKIIDSPDTN